MLSNDQTDEEQSAFLREVLLGNPEAIEFCEVLFGISQVWDDVVDGDEFTAENVNEMMWDALVVLPCNTFYQQHFGVLQPLLQAAIVDWLDSNELCRGDKEEQCAAYVLRDTITTIIIHCARLIGGYEHMRKISLRVRTELYKEPIEEYMREHNER